MDLGEQSEQGHSCISTLFSLAHTTASPVISDADSSHYPYQSCSIYTSLFPFTLCQNVYCTDVLAFQPSVLPLCRTPSDKSSHFFCLLDLWLWVYMSCLRTCLSLTHASGLKPVSLPSCHKNLSKAFEWIAIVWIFMVPRGRICSLSSYAVRLCFELSIQPCSQWPC